MPISTFRSNQLDVFRNLILKHLNEQNRILIQ